jgi:hypothetical protein
MPENAKPTAANGGLGNSNEDQRAAGFVFSVAQNGTVVNIGPLLTAWQRLCVEADRRSA